MTESVYPSELEAWALLYPAGMIGPLSTDHTFGDYRKAGDRIIELANRIRTERIDVSEMEKIINGIIDDLTKERHELFKNEAINWADLNVVSIEEVTPLYPEKESSYLIVAIEEADPGCYRFKQEIIRRYFDLTGKWISVRTNW